MESPLRAKTARTALDDRLTAPIIMPPIDLSEIDLLGAEDLPATELPDHKGFHPSLFELRKAAQKLAFAAAQVLHAHYGVNREFASAFQAAYKAAQKPRFTKPVIGLVGGTGQGKSESVNAITEQPDASKSAGSGNALTSVAMLFVSRLHGQQRQYGAIVHIVKQDCLRATVTRWVRDYARFHFDADSELSEEELAERRQLADLAKIRFRTLSNNKAGFATNDELFKFF